MLLVRQADELSRLLLQLANDKEDSDKGELSIEPRFNYVKKAFPSRMIMPLQDALTATLPSSSGDLKSHNAFPVPVVEILGMSSREAGALISRHR